MISTKFIFNTILQIIAYPLFILLHLSFILSSLTLRIYQTFPSPLRNDQIDQTEIEDESHISSLTQRNPPKHLALILVPCKKRRNGEKDALVRSILRSVQGSLDLGIEELSIWDGQGLIQSVLPNLMKTLSTTNRTSSTNRNGLPPSPPDSKPSTPPNGPTQDISDSDDDEAGSEYDGPSSPSPPRKQGRNLVERLENLGNEIRSMIVYSDTNPSSSSSSNSSKGLKIHFLPPSCSDELLVNLTKKYVQQRKNIDEIDVRSIDKDIKEQLHFNSDPELLLIHHLSPEPFWRSILPRKAPELWGYPFWSLRITEIYQYPSPLPLLYHINPVITTLRSSSLPFLRKLGYSISQPTKLDPDGVLNKEEWDVAMRAWSKVEQRLGK